MKKLKLIVNAEIELQGKLKYLDKQIKENKTHFFFYINNHEKAQINYCKLITNDNGEYYNILETCLEQGRRFRISLIFEVEVVVGNKDVNKRDLILYCSSTGGVYKMTDVKITNFNVFNV